MYAWSICTQLHGSTSLGYECKVICVKFLNSLNFLHLFIYSLTSSQYPGHHASNLMLFVKLLLHSEYHHVSFLDEYIIGCPSCDNIPDIECSFASVVNIKSFFWSKIFDTGFFTIITFNLSKAFFCFSDQINSTFFFLKFANSSVESVYFGTYRL